MVTVSQRPKGRRLMTIYRKSAAKEEKSKYKGPEAEVNLNMFKVKQEGKYSQDM